MSLDNVLAVAGAAQRHLEALIFGLVLSVALMGFASAFIANLLDRHRWIAYLGLAIILIVALRMVYAGLDDVTGPQRDAGHSARDRAGNFLTKVAISRHFGFADNDLRMLGD